MLEPLIDEAQTRFNQQFASLDVEGLVTSNDLLSPAMNNLSPNIMGRTAKFAVSNKNLNKRENQNSGGGGDQGQGTSSSTKVAGKQQRTKAFEDRFSKLLTPPSDFAPSAKAECSQKDRILRETVHDYGNKFRSRGDRLVIDEEQTIEASFVPR